MSRARRGMGQDERFAITVAGRVLGTDVREHDIDGRQHAVDAIVHYRDGRTAALEVSSVRAEKDAGITGFIAERGASRTVTGLRRNWLVEVPQDFHPADVRKVEDALRACEEHGMHRLQDLAGHDRAVREMLDGGLRGHAADGPGDAQDTSGSRVYLMLRPLGGFTGRGLAALPGELADVLETGLMRATSSLPAAWPSVTSCCWCGRARSASRCLMAWHSAGRFPCNRLACRLASPSSG